MTPYAISECTDSSSRVPRTATRRHRRSRAGVVQHSPRSRRTTESRVRDVGAYLLPFLRRLVRRNTAPNRVAVVVLGVLSNVVVVAVRPEANVSVFCG